VYVPVGEPPQIVATESSPPVGLLPNPRYEEQALELKPGDRVYLSTDGVIEAENSEGQEFGLARLIDALDRYRHSSLTEGLASAMASAQQWCAPSAFADDVSMLALEISNTAG
jgi:serine phosphatase RsbU (regulator of sigma subunit)